MELVSFVASSTADAVRQVRERLGPSAVVAEVRPLTPSRSWLGRRRTRFEVLAYTPPAHQPLLDAMSDSPASPVLSTGLAVEAPVSTDDTPGAVAEVAAPQTLPMLPPRSGGGTWRVGGLLEASGVLPTVAQRVVDDLRRTHGDNAPELLGEELKLARGALAALWRPCPQDRAEAVHVFVGPPGVGKTTCLCKWLTQLVLLEGRQAEVWRLDSAMANTAESLSVYCEVLGVPLQRSWRPADEHGDAVRLVDLPGTDWRNVKSLERLRSDLERLGTRHVHLVVSGAYETAVLLQQARAFSRVGISDVIVSHLDEEARWGKLWNLVVGTNFPVRFLSAGQNVPGDFLRASSEMVLLRQFPAQE